MVATTGTRGRVPVPSRLEPWLARLHVDFDPPRRQPLARQVVAATVLSIVGSLGADAILVAIGTRVFPSTRGYVHFAFGDYAKLTVIGVLIACAAWPIVTRITSTPRWLFFRMAIAVTVVLWLPDVWIFLHGSPGRAVAVLMLMHLAVAVVTYNLLVRVARTGRRRSALSSRAGDPLTGRGVRIR